MSRLRRKSCFSLLAMRRFVRVLLRVRKKPSDDKNIHTYIRISVIHVYSYIRSLELYMSRDGQSKMKGKKALFGGEN